jgi:integrase
MFLFAKKERWCTEKNIPNWDFPVEKEAPARERMTNLRNYTDVINTLRSWVAQAKTDKEKYNRRMLKHFILLISNTGMRSGEAFALTNRDIEIHRNKQECVITIRPETSKVRRGRKLSSTGGRLGDSKRINYLIRWIDMFQRHKEPNDLVFATFDNKGKKKRTASDVIYKGYGLLRKQLEDIGLGWFDPYHCRHFFITAKLLAGEPIHIVAKVCGTSVKEIESTYSHVLTEMASRNFGNKQVVLDEEGGYGVHDTSAARQFEAQNDTSTKG